MGKNAQTATWKIQNEVIACASEYVRRTLRVSSSKSSYFSLISANEVTDHHTNKDILVAFLRF